MLQIRNLAKVTHPSEVVDPSKIDFGKTYTPNLFRMEYRDGAWSDPRIEPLRPFELHPGAKVLHYAQTIFEGLKAYRHSDGSIALFRPEMNARRLNRSADRLEMPAIDPELFVEASKMLVETERHHVPAAPGSLYVRPTMIGVEPSIGVKGSNEIIFYILCLPAGSYFKKASGGPGAVRVLVSESVVRASPGSTGDVKAGGNYAVTLKITGEAARKGCAQVLFLDSVERKRIEEMGGMNVFFVRDGVLITPPLKDTILAGITRDTILQLAADLNLPAQETEIRIDDVVRDIEAGRVTEAFASGTAAAITGIGSFLFEDGKEVHIGEGKLGEITTRLHDRLVGIQFGEYPDEHSWITRVCRVEDPVSS